MHAPRFAAGVLLGHEQVRAWRNLEEYPNTLEDQ